jgi:PAS domain S-box-containing protein
MSVKIPNVRRSDSLYAKIGGKESLEALVSEFFRRVRQDLMLAADFGHADSAALQARFLDFLVRLLGGPAADGVADEPISSSLPQVHDAQARISGHLAESLHALRVPKSLADDVVALFAHPPVAMSSSNPAARPQKGNQAMSKNHKSSAAVLEHSALDDKTTELEAIGQDKLADDVAQIKAMSRTHVTIEYDMNGMILDANENFTQLVGYDIDEIRGKHVSIFVDAATRQSPQYLSASSAMWVMMNRGESCLIDGERSSKQGRELWFR